MRASGDGHVPGPLHPSFGQEAVAVGVCGVLRTDDVLLSTHRGHGHTMAKGADPVAMMCELLGRDGGCCGGKGGSMHIADFEIGMLGANGVVGANTLIAVGAAHAIRRLGDDRVVVGIFGDGAVNRGPFLEGLNWAKLFELPVLFVCEDNGFAATTRTREVTAGDGPAARAESLGIPARIADGNDVITIADVATELTATIRGGGPRFLHARTYRLGGHTAADPGTYRSSEEVEERRKDDPIARCARRLVELGCEPTGLDAIAGEAAAEMSEALDAALASPWPDVSRAFEDVQDLQHSDFRR